MRRKEDSDHWLINRTPILTSSNNQNVWSLSSALQLQRWSTCKTARVLYVWLLILPKSQTPIGVTFTKGFMQNQKTTKMNLQAHTLNQEKQSARLLLPPWMQTCKHKTHKTKQDAILSTRWLVCSWKWLFSFNCRFRAVQGQPFSTLGLLLVTVRRKGHVWDSEMSDSDSEEGDHCLCHNDAAVSETAFPRSYFLLQHQAQFAQ